MTEINKIITNCKELLDQWGESFKNSDTIESELIELDINKELNKTDGEKISEDSERIIKDLLFIVEAIKPQRGTSRIRIQPINESKKDLLSNAENAIHQISIELQTNRSARKTKIDEILRDNKFTPSDYYRLFLAIISKLIPKAQPPEGTKIGGLIIPSEDEIKNFDTEIKSESGKSEQEERERQILEAQQPAKTERRHERILYPIAEKILVEQLYEAITLGVARRLPGEWQTPDVIGYKLSKLDVLGGVNLELVSIEVKWFASKLAIAEAKAHQQLTHKTYLMVNQEYNEISTELQKEIAASGLGLICKKSKSEEEFEIHNHSQENQISRQTIDTFLSIALDEETKESIRQEIAINSTGSQLIKCLLATMGNVSK